jgi:hypothetical protein
VGYADRGKRRHRLGRDRPDIRRHGLHHCRVWMFADGNLLDYWRGVAPTWLAEMLQAR